MSKLRILTWHVHGNYLFYLSHVPHEFYIPVKPGRPQDYVGLPQGFPWPENMHEVPADEVRNLQLDCILFQRKNHYLEEQYEIFSSDQRKLPQIYLEHDPPQGHPTNTKHEVDDPNILLVHVTPFNDLMWDCGQTKTIVIDHGVVIPEGIRYKGEIPRGISVVNNIKTRGRRLGADIYEYVKEKIPLDLVGMGSKDIGGLGEIDHHPLPSFEAQYRFFFNPIRYTSLGLAVCEAMMIGMPIIGLATTEMATAIQNGISGYVGTDLNKLIEHMNDLLKDFEKAWYLGQNARLYAMERFNINRFIKNWKEAFSLATGVVSGRSSSFTFFVSGRGEP